MIQRSSRRKTTLEMLGGMYRNELSTPSTDKSPRCSNNDKIGQAHIPQLMEWLEEHVKARLSDIDTKLDNLSMHVCRFAGDGETWQRPDVPQSQDVTHIVSGDRSRAGGPPYAMSSIESVGRGRFDSSISGRVKSSDECSHWSEEEKVEDIGQVSSAAVEPPVVQANSLASSVALNAYVRSLSENLSERICAQSASQHRAWVFLEDAESSDVAWWFALASTPIILISVVLTLVQTMTPPPLDGVPAAAAEMIFDCAFAVEILIRFAVCPNRIRFVLSPYNVIDLTSIFSLALRASIGFVISQEQQCGFACSILLYVNPVLRLLKTLRRFETFQLLLSAFWFASDALPALLFVFTIIALAFSSLIYFVEPRSNISSWPMALWLTIISMTTLGYGDVAPETSAGRAAITILVILGALYMAMPLGILGNAFTETWKNRHRVLAVRRTRTFLVQRGFNADDIPKLFRMFDTDQDGELDFADFRTMLTEMRMGFTEDRIIDLFECFDSNADGGLDEAEFVRAIFPSSYHKVYKDKLQRIRTTQRYRDQLADEGRWHRRLNSSSSVNHAGVDAALVQHDRITIEQSEFSV